MAIRSPIATSPLFLNLRMSIHTRYCIDHIAMQSKNPFTVIHLSQNFFMLHIGFQYNLHRSILSHKGPWSMNFGRYGLGHHIMHSHGLTFSLSSTRHLLMVASDFTWLIPFFW